MGAFQTGDPDGPTKKREDSGIDFIEKNGLAWRPSEEDLDFNHYSHRSVGNENLQQTVETSEE